MVQIIERLKLLKTAFAKLPYIDDYMQQTANYHQLKHYAENNVLTSKENGLTDKTYDGKQLVISLTTHGKRINTVFQTIESIFRQTCRANKVVLYLSRQEFNETTIPVTLKKQTERGLEIRYVKDIGPHTKLIPALHDFPDDLIVTVDDDYMYPFDLIERLVNVHHLHPNCVCCSFSRIIRTRLGGIAPYDSFKMNFPDETTESMSFLAEGFGGILYPPGSLHSDVFREDLFMKLAPSADDLWFKAMELLQGTPVCQVPNDKSWFIRMASEEGVQDIGLKHVNVGLHRNDEQLKAILNYYPHIIEKLQR